MVKAMLDSNFDVTLSDKDGATPLHCAAWKGHFEGVKALIGVEGSPHGRLWWVLEVSVGLGGCGEDGWIR